jgi:hypothetical protein
MLTCNNPILKVLLIAMLFMGIIQMMKMKRMKMSMMKILMMIGKRFITCHRIKIIPDLCIKWGRISHSILFQLFPQKLWHLHPLNKFTIPNNKMMTISVWLNPNQNQMTCLTIYLWTWIQIRHFKTIISGKSLVWILSTTKRISIITTTF